MKKKRIIIISAVTVVIAVIIVIAMKYRKNHRQIIDNNKLDNVWITQFYKFESVDLLDESYNFEGIYESGSNYILKIKCTKDTKFDYQTVQNMDRLKKYLKATENLRLVMIL